MRKHYNFLKVLVIILLGWGMNASAQITTLGYTGSLQTYTVPAGVTTINITSEGAAGGGMTNYGFPGGNGAIMSGNFAVTPGQVLNILVGGQGQTVVYEGGGGGGSFVWDSASNILFIAAGGGGGAGQDDNSSTGIAGIDATTSINGINGYTMPNGGGIAGNGGTAPIGSGFDSVFDYAGGGGGWLSNGSDGTLFICGIDTCKGGLTPLNGGAGGAFGGSAGDDGYGGYGGGGGASGRCGAIGAGGGGGYSGGGAGGELVSDIGTYTPGGGGGSYNAGTLQANTVGNAGDGVVIIKVICSGTSSVITGPGSLCQGQTVALSDTTSGGTWSSSDTTTATIDSATGMVTGIAAGSVNIYYTLGTSCLTVSTVTINPLPSAISGAKAVCVADSVTFSDGGGGTWSTTATTVAVGATSGVVTGVTAGTAIITYTLPTGCATTAPPLVINPLPAAITGPGNVCLGSTVTLNDTTSGGAWSSPGSSSATVNPGTGVVTGLSTGTTIITYTVSGCTATIVETVNALPNIYAVTGGSYCAGGTGVAILLSNSDTGTSYVLSYSGSPLDTVAGTDTAISFRPQTVAGSYTVFATNTATTCTDSMSTPGVITIITLPAVHSVTGGGTYCAGGAGEAVGVDTADSGVNYLLYHGTSVIDTVAGAGTALSFGLQTAAGTYKVIAMDTTTGCTNKMADSAVIIVTPSDTPAVRITADPGDTVCQGSLVIFTAHPVHPGPAPTYQWNVNGTNVGTDTSTYSYIPKNNDNVFVAMVSDAACIIIPLALNRLAVKVDSAYFPSVDIIATAGTIVSKGQKDTLKAVVFNGGPTPSYQWYVNGSAIIGSTNSTYTSPVFANKDSVSCVVTSSGICKYQSFNSVILQINSVGIRSLTNEGNLSILPNPNKGAFTIKGAFATTTDEEVSFELTNMLGQVVYKNKVMTQNGNINEHVQLNNTVSGMYLLNVVSATEHQVFHVVIEQ